jgi:iron complex transport system ATP-binding protein
VHDPDAFVFDEPTSGLDLSAGFDYLARIRDLARRGRSLVVVTHHLGEIPPEIERVIILKNGAVYADGDKKTLLSAEVLSDVYEIPLRVAEIDGHFMVYPGSYS